MRTITQVLDAVKSRHGIRSDYKLALFLGLGESALANYRHGRSLPNEAALERIAQALEEDPALLLAEVQAMRSSDDTAARLWRMVADRLRAATPAALAIALALPLLALHSPDASAVESVRYVKFDAVALIVGAVSLVRLAIRVARLSIRPSAAHG